MRVLITSPHRGAGYALATSLRPHCTWLAATVARRRWSFARSRLYDATLASAPPSDDWIAHPEAAAAQEHVTGIIRFCVAQGITLVWPSNDAEMFALARQRTQLDGEGLTLVAPPYDVLRACTDKYRVIQAAQAVGFPVAPATLCGSLDEAHDWLDTHAPPVVVKSRWSTNSSGVHICLTRDHASDAAARCISLHGSVVMQEYIRGGKETSLHFLVPPGAAPIASFALGKLRHLAPSYSTAIQVEAMPPELHAAPALLRRLDLSGFCVVQTRRDERDGLHKLIEINTRFGTNSRILFALAPALAWGAAYVATRPQGLFHEIEAVAPAVGARGGSPVEDALSLWSLVLAKLDRPWARGGAELPACKTYVRALAAFYRSGAAIDLHTRALRTDPLAALPYFAGLARFLLPGSQRRRALRLIPWKEVSA